ncbi:uncharacterized protein LOC123012956 [Tribolium madens]|uniref:uncharacterized protein LOC123012956 n=1 Tax=Tribolium madens TaxID=41895 RepID=UPI001CF75669|nr:uncharacterized protein LOC123012956 [Tribolium madens]
MFVIFIAAAVLSTVTADSSGIKNLAGEPDYRQVRLHWEVDDDSQSEFQVRYCELQTWGAHRCRTQMVNESEENEVDEQAKGYSVEVKGLRMATTYSFEVKRAKEREDRAEGDDKDENTIVIPTKGFSAKATQCLPHASEIEVSTGPYFGGRIAVEAADGERCALDGEASSPRDTYTLRINHTECGSQVNETTVATFVIVQENLPILTHSTRRFLVLCSYQPETLTVRAGINLPTGHSGRGQAHMAPVPYEEDNTLGRRGRNFRTGRLLQKPEALVKEETKISENLSKTNAVPVIVIAMLSIAGVIGIIAIAIKITNKKLLEDLDNISIASEVTTSSCSTSPDSEISCHSQPRSVIHV